MIINSTLERDLVNPEFNSWTTEQLRNAWLVRFGSGWINYSEIAECEDIDYMDIGVVLDQRKQLEVWNSPSTFYPQYRLIKCK